MNRRHLLWILAAVTFLEPLAGRAETSDPIQDYLNFGNTERDSYLSQFREIFSLQLNIDGGPGPSVFLTTSGFGGRLGNIWTVYVPQETGYQRLFVAKFRSYLSQGYIRGWRSASS